MVLVAIAVISTAVIGALLVVVHAIPGWVALVAFVAAVPLRYFVTNFDARQSARVVMWSAGLAIAYRLVEAFIKELS